MQQGMHTCIPGVIDSYDSAKGTATATPTGQFVLPNGKKLAYPQLHEVPVVLLQSNSQNCTIAFPIKSGDGCLLFFSEQQLDRFRDNQDPKCDLRFDLSNAIAIVGLVREANSVAKDACDNDAIIIDNEGSRVTIKEDAQECKVGGATFTIKNGEITATATMFKVNGNLAVTGDVDAQGTVTGGEIVAKNIALSTHTHPTAAPGSPSPPTPGA
jgi:hypothetical protein